jgi:hypothetical protein
LHERRLHHRAQPEEVLLMILDGSVAYSSVATVDDGRDLLKSIHRSNRELVQEANKRRN